LRELPIHNEGVSGTTFFNIVLLMVEALVTARDKFVQPTCIEQWYSTFFVCVPPDIISLQLCSPTVVGAEIKLYIFYNLHLNKLIK
jgi:hypothetical protein